MSLDDETRKLHQCRIASLGGRFRARPWRPDAGRQRVVQHARSPAAILRPLTLSDGRAFDVVLHLYTRHLSSKIDRAYRHTPASAPDPVQLHRDPRNACHAQALGIRLIRQGASDSGTDREAFSTGAVSLASHLRSPTYA